MSARTGLVIKGVSHRFGDRLALDSVSLQAVPGRIHALVGPNGAGKTTLLRICATLIKREQGSVLVVPRTAAARRLEQTRRLVGYLQDDIGVYPGMTVFEYLDFFGAVYSMNFAERDLAIERVLEITGLADYRDAVAGHLSLGMTRRIGVARVLLQDPEVYLLDEPANGLDPRARVELATILRALADMDKTILVSSHVLSDLAELCDDVTVLDRGSVKFSGPMDALLDDSSQRCRVELSGRSEPCERALRELDAVVEVSDDGRVLLVGLGGALDSTRLLQTILDSGAEPVSFEPVRRRLDEVFLELTTPGVAE